MRYAISSDFLSLVPEFHRSVVVARGVSNTGRSAELFRVLVDEWERAGNECERATMPHIAAWDIVYRRFGANPEQQTPSIRFLLQQAARRKPVRSITPLVDIFNVVSLRYNLPCGGDDLDALDEGGIELTLALGVEEFSSLAKPDRQDPPIPGEAVYITLPSRRAMCRRLNWRNSHFSRIQECTTNVAINIDALIGPVTIEHLHRATEDLAALIAQYCGGRISTHFFGPQASVSDI
jgi:DNA/RNA-binding domain of Phe-tRNA-synthetase-like protein